MKMELNKFHDINGKVPQIGDVIAYAVPGSMTTCSINIGIITNILITNSMIKLIVNRTKRGMNAYNWGIKTDEYQFELRYPASHIKYVILEDSEDTDFVSLSDAIRIANLDLMRKSGTIPGLNEITYKVDPIYVKAKWNEFEGVCKYNVI